MPHERFLPPRRALVVFSGKADLPWLRVLKKGYRHCFAVIDGGGNGGWVIYNPLSQGTEITVMAPDDGAAIAGHFRNSGLAVIETRLTRPPRRAAPWRPYTCVEAIKRVLGLQNRSIFTPWQLYKFLNQTKRENNP